MASQRETPDFAVANVARFDHLTREQIQELAPKATVVIPLGSTEQHGPHLPVCVDTAIVTALAERAAVRASADVPVVVAPALPFGFAHHHIPFGGTVSIDVSTYLDVLTSIGRSVALGGFKRILFLNGHGGNDAAVRAVGARLLFESGLQVHVAGTSYWTCAEDTLKEFRLQVGPTPGHAGGFETACMMALHPELVRSERLPDPEPELQPQASTNMPGAAIVRPGRWEASDGRTDDSRRATPQIGNRIIDAVSERIAQFIVDFHRASEASG